MYEPGQACRISHPRQRRPQAVYGCRQVLDYQAFNTRLEHNLVGRLRLRAHSAQLREYAIVFRGVQTYLYSFS